MLDLTELEKQQQTAFAATIQLKNISRILYERVETDAMAIQTNFQDAALASEMTPRMGPMDDFGKLAIELKATGAGAPDDNA
jgi:hypothetical protein